MKTLVLRIVVSIVVLAMMYAAYSSALKRLQAVDDWYNPERITLVIVK